MLNENWQHLHAQGYVHGDLRPTNILINDKKEIKIIDFDWAGKKDETRYPIFMNLDIPWHSDAKPLQPIRIEQNLIWFKKKKKIKPNFCPSQ